MPKLTDLQIQEKVFSNTLETCDYISGYENAQSIIKIKCRIHQCEFETKWENVRRSNRPHYACPYCQKEERDKKYENNRIELECAYCHKKFITRKSQLEKSKSNLHFCCREHKDLAQRIESGQQFEKMRPEHYGYISETNYREYALRNYPNKCLVCGYDEEPKILQVHHRDSNRQNNELKNLAILCPNCHAKITWGGYILLNNKIINKDKIKDN